ncbi:MAG: thioredoxin domain-containing protein [Sterolibacteriaceae bacterium]|nr:thioredoxin domain-containing protein [Candidatus Methylophosphatis haderslevensis]
MPNRLAQETSPYLQQHSENPVDWYAWGHEAVALARATDRPILLSIGYSACHWCHVMAHESFEDAEVAAVMNRLYVNVKVDREERPDLDQIYQSAHHLLTRRAGGWPLTLFLTPDGTPFFAGTYFPKTPRYNLPGFVDLLERVAGAYARKRGEIDQQNQALRDALAGEPENVEHSPAALSSAPGDVLFRLLESSFDPQWGGFGGAPKFPHPGDLAFLLRRHIASGDPRARQMVLTTLDRMAAGGLYDHLGGGFSRYSVDGQWMIPHFEKMLYDNGPLLALYAEAAVLTGAPRYRQVAGETAAWVMREMQSPQGGYFSSLDADSEGEEGKFYVWAAGEVEALLSAAEFAVVSRHYGLDQPANFEGRHWHLRVATDLQQIADRAGLGLAECKHRLACARAKLAEARERRVRPARDDKILTSWNALMIAGMARAGMLLARPDWVDSARRASDFLRRTLWQGGRLLATCKDGRAHLNAYLDDYAFLLNAQLELLQADFRAEDIDWAIALADVLLDQFEDPDRGGFFFTSHDHESLIARPKPAHDNATPSGNAVAAYALQRLGHLVGEPRYLDAAARCLAAFFGMAQRAPGGFATFAIALEEHLRPPTSIVLRGPAGEVAQWHARLLSRLRPATLVIPVAENRLPLPAPLDHPYSETVNAWVCKGVSCMPPVTDRAELERICSAPDIG